jgi:alpha-D-ribose 1-methylphosphonate 5-triphosphate synthase subunit PhnG
MASTLSVLARADAATVKTFAEGLIPELGRIKVERNRTGIVMLPMRDTARGAKFFVGEVLMAEAEISTASVWGYGACLGRDVQHALALAIIDATERSGRRLDEIKAFVHEHATRLGTQDAAMAARVESTRVSMETF